MSRETKEQAAIDSALEVSKRAYKHSLRQLQIELVKLQRHFIQCENGVLAP